jgi:hypothetical protein
MVTYVSIKNFYKNQQPAVATANMIGTDTLIFIANRSTNKVSRIEAKNPKGQ